MIELDKADGPYCRDSKNRGESQRLGCKLASWIPKLLSSPRPAATSVAPHQRRLWILSPSLASGLPSLLRPCRRRSLTALVVVGAAGPTGEAFSRLALSPGDLLAQPGSTVQRAVTHRASPVQSAGRETQAPPEIGQSQFSCVEARKSAAPEARQAESALSCLPSLPRACHLATLWAVPRSTASFSPPFSLHPAAHKGGIRHIQLTRRVGWVTGSRSLTRFRLALA